MVWACLGTWGLERLCAWPPMAPEGGLTMEEGSRVQGSRSVPGQQQPGWSCSPQRSGLAGDGRLSPVRPSPSPRKGVGTPGDHALFDLDLLGRFPGMGGRKGSWS